MGDYTAEAKAASGESGTVGRMVRGWTEYGGPEMTGFIAGELAAPYATPLSGMVGATIGNVAKQVMTRRPREMSVTQAALEPTLTVAGASASPYVARGLRAVSPRGLLRAGLGTLEEIPGIRQVFRRMGISPTLVDLTGSKAAGQMENLAGSIPTSSTIVKSAQQAQNEQLAQAFEREFGKLGSVGTRAGTGQSAVEGIQENFRALQQTAAQMRANITKIMTADDTIPINTLRSEAKRLADQLRSIKYPEAVDTETLKLLDQISAGYQPAQVVAAARTAAAKVPIDPRRIEDAVSKLIGRGIPPAQAGERVLADEMQAGRGAQELVDHINAAMRRSSGNAKVALDPQRVSTIAQSMKPAAPVAARPGASPGEMTLDQWYATQSYFGEAARDVNLLSSQDRGIYKALYKAIQKDLDAWAPKNRELVREVRHFKGFYKNNIVPFNESVPGRVASGRINPEDAAQKLFTRDGLTELQNVKRWAGGQLFLDLRNRWLASVFEKATNPQTGEFVMGNFRRAWNSIDREVKQRAFSQAERSGLDDLATLSERIQKKYTPAGGGSPSGTPLAQVPGFQIGAFMAGAGGLGAGIATGNIPAIAGSVAEVLVAYHGPRWLARMVTTPEGIDFLTRAYGIPAASQAGQTLLGGLGAMLPPLTTPGGGRNAP